ncbi:hypothetical protein [Ulvibacterium sp.]|uniref:hypothetical protein n=1 Tax=Ulvibacterium sp. TaxID=2665914 RepID=UPI003BAC5954
MRKKLFVPILFVSVVFSCTREPDFSKTLQEYYDFGLPKIERKWSYDELEGSAKLLGRLKEKDSLPLPKLNSKKSGKYFQRIISALPRLANGDSLSYKRKTRDFFFFQKIVKRLVLIYGTTEKEQEYYSNELIELNKLTLEEVANMTLLYYDTIEQGSVDYAYHLENNSRQFQRGVLTILEASLQNHESHVKYKPGDKIELARAFSENVAKIWHLIDSDSKEKLLTQIRSIAGQNEIGKVQSIYSDFLETIESKDQ